MQLYKSNPIYSLVFFKPWKLTQSTIKILDPSYANNAVPTQRYVHDDSMPSFGF